MTGHLHTNLPALYALLGDDVRLHDAFTVAEHAHSGQWRSTPKGKVPYILHPLEVFFQLRAWGVTDSTCLIAGLLHDTVEDAPEKVWDITASPLRNYITPDSARERALLGLAQRFDDDVSQVVDGLSNVDGVPYIEHVSAAIVDPRVLVGKLADFTRNALTLDPAHPRYAKLLAKYAPLKPILARRLEESPEAQSLLPMWRTVLKSLR